MIMSTDATLVAAQEHTQPRNGQIDPGRTPNGSRKFPIRTGPKRWLFLAQSVAYPAGAVVLPWYLHIGWLWIPLGILITILALRLLGRYTTAKLARAERKGRRLPSHDVAPNEILAFEKRITDASGRFSPEQLYLFAASILDPAALRRRITDHCDTRQRVIEHEVCIEFDLDPTFGPLHLSSAEKAAAKDALPAGGAAESGDSRFLAIMLSPKGDLHDNCRVVDGDNHILPALSYREYRVLMGLTLRSLLKSAFSNGKISDKAIELERSYFELLIQHGIIAKGDGVDAANISANSYPRTTDKRIEDVVYDLEALKQDGDSVLNVEYIDMIIKLVPVIAKKYAVVVAFPDSHSDRFFATYSYTEIPSLDYDPSVRQKLRMLLGARPVFLRLSAANAATCQSYHLVVSAPDDLYVGDFDAPCVTGGQIPTDSRVDYHRVRGRRGQHYFHLYTRMGRGNDADLSLLKVDVKFFEVPPGSVGRAAISALACALTCIGVSITTTHSIGTVDSNLAGILLTIPSAAAVWLGFETRPSRLLEGTLAARLSLVATFTTSLAAGVLLMLQKAGFITGTSGGSPSIFWLTISGFAAVNAAMTCGIYWERVSHYRTIAMRPAEQSSVILAR